MTIESRRLTIQERTSAISATGGNRACDIHGCDYRALYLAGVDGQRYYLCNTHMQQFWETEKEKATAGEQLNEQHVITHSEPSVNETGAGGSNAR